MCSSDLFPSHDMEGGMEISLNKIKEDDIIKILFAENPGIVIQVKDKHKDQHHQDRKRLRFQQKWKG